jgi:hypothetical protein
MGKYILSYNEDRIESRMIGGSLLKYSFMSEIMELDEDFAREVPEGL